MKELHLSITQKSIRRLLACTLLLLPTMASAQCPDNNHPHMIDLGLPSGTKWACCNVGAQKPEDNGNHFAWGEVNAKSSYDFESYEFFTSWADYPWYQNIGIVICRTDYDVAYKQWGEDWQMPLKEQMQELIDNCTAEWKTQGGTSGLAFTGKNGNSIFLPAIGTKWSTNTPETGTTGYYWSAELLNQTTPWCLEFSSDGATVSNHIERCSGVVVRPVTPKKHSGYPGVEGGWVERVNNGTLEGSEYYSFGYQSYYQTIQSSQVVADPDDASNHCLKMVKSNDYGYPDLHVNISSNSSTLYPGQKYKFYMRVKASQPTQIQSWGLSSYGWPMDEGMLGTYDVSTEWTTIEYSGVVTDAQAGIGIMGFLFGDATPVEYYFDDISFQVEMGDSFTAESQEGTELIFTVISENEQTCAVGDLTRTDGIHSAMTDIAVEGTLTIPQAVEHNGKTYAVKFVGEGAFAVNTKFDNIIVPEGVTYIGGSAFWISLLKSITIPSTVLSFGHQAFDMNNSLESVYCYVEHPFVIDEAMFRKQYDSSTGTYPWSAATLYVPVGCKSSYEATECWNLFLNIVEMGIAPIDEGKVINIGDNIDADTNLDGNVVGDVYFNINDGSYDAAGGCVVVNAPTDDSFIDGKDIFGDDFKEGYNGIVFMVPSGSGEIKVEAETTGNMVLKVKIGNQKPITMTLNGKLTISFPYDVTEDTYVYIYGGENASSAKGMRKAAGTDALKIYSIEVASSTDGIEAIDDSALTIGRSPIYNLNGQRVNSQKINGQYSRLPKGVYIVNGKKMVVNRQ